MAINNMKRVSLDERRNRRPVDDVIFKSTEEVATIEESPQTNNDTNKNKPVIKKLTAYITQEQYVALEEIQLAELKRTGKKPDKMDLFQEAINLLIEKRHNF